MAEWHTPATAKTQWRDAPTDAELASLLLAARHQCEAFGTTQAAAENVIPEEWRIAHLMQAKAIWQAQRSSPQDTVDSGGESVRVYPMDWQVKSLLRPTRGMPGIG